LAELLGAMAFGGRLANRDYGCLAASIGLFVLNFVGFAFVQCLCDPVDWSIDHTAGFVVCTAELVALGLVNAVGAVGLSWLVRAQYVVNRLVRRAPFSEFAGGPSSCLGIGLGFVGMGVALLPRALPFAYLGWILVLPALCWREPVLGPGQWRLHAVDVGQGSAIIVETLSKPWCLIRGYAEGHKVMKANVRSCLICAV